MKQLTLGTVALFAAYGMGFVQGAMSRWAAWLLCREWREMKQDWLKWKQRRTQPKPAWDHTRTKAIQQAILRQAEKERE